jgi:aminopeptidase 2
MSSRRLSRSQHISPKHYDVHLTTDLDSGQFCGSVKIDFIIKQNDQTCVKLDTSHLTIDLSSISLMLISPLTKLECSIELNELHEILEIQLSNKKTFSIDIPYCLTINSFSGHITTQNQTGFYRSTVDILSYSDNNNTNSNEMSIIKKHYGITQMSPTHCRRVFPCFDEPSLRATFDLTLDIPINMLALSNMPQKDSQDNLLNSGTKRIRFQRTPSMPTFLLCFVIGEFDVVKAEPVERLKTDNG